MQSRDASRCRATARTWGLLVLLASTLGACDDSSSGGEADTGPAPIPRDAAIEAPAADSLFDGVRLLPTPEMQ